MTSFGLQGCWNWRPLLDGKEVSLCVDGLGDAVHSQSSQHALLKAHESLAQSCQPNRALFAWLEGLQERTCRHQTSQTSGPVVGAGHAGGQSQQGWPRAWQTDWPCAGFPAVTPKSNEGRWHCVAAAPSQTGSRLNIEDLSCRSHPAWPDLIRLSDCKTCKTNFCNAAGLHCCRQRIAICKPWKVGC